MSRTYLGVNQGFLHDAPSASDYGFLAWAFDMAISVSGSATGLGVLTMSKVHLRAPASVTTMTTYVNTAGAGLTNVGFGLYRASDRTLIASAVNAGGATAAAFQGTGTKPVTITAQALAAGAYYVGFWFTGTTAPTLARGNSGGSALNAGTTLVSGNGLRFAAADTGLTTAAPATFTQTGNAPAAYWVALS
jgi:hypothetical protein